jgi:FkbM family methyltransferase
VLRFGDLLKRARAGAGNSLHRTASATKPYRIGELTILLKREHMLPDYQSKHKLYDRFLPILCKHLDDLDRWVIDVGANVGDTAVAVGQACRNPILCIEGYEEYFTLLKCNINTSFANRGRPVICVNAIAGSGRFSGFLKGDGTSAGLVQGPDQRAVSLDKLARDAGVPAAAVALIKVDTDGYDGDVILSAPDILAGSNPVIFWENYFSSMEQMQELETFYHRLRDFNYHHVWVFDNFGNLMLQECSFSNLVDLNHYVASQEFHNCTRTIYYTDILAAGEEWLEPVREAISAFRSTAITQV